MRLMNILHDSVVDGRGLRTVFFFAGCPHQCKGCHNPQSWRTSNGTEISLSEALDEVISNPLADVTFSGGEPFVQAAAAYELAREVRRRGKSLWVYTGYTLEQLIEKGDPNQLALLAQCDMLVDGPFRLEERDITLPFRGSRNQRLLTHTDIERIVRERARKQDVLLFIRKKEEWAVSKAM